MDSNRFPQYNSLFATDQDCISYLFQKRWPEGFHCPFCNRYQKDIAPAHTVVCRYCRKQSSITANTLMHGSKKSLSEWMQVAAQFCFTREGISARTLQHSFHIATYQTAWNWLKKLRKAASIAESTPLKGPVHLTQLTVENDTSKETSSSRIACLMEVSEYTNQPGRIRLISFSETTAGRLSDFIKRVVPMGSSIAASSLLSLHLIDIEQEYILRITDTENSHAIDLGYELQLWMRHLYRGATDPKYLQEYLDEFCFRHNTATWNNRLAILDHLLTGIMGGNASQPRTCQKTASGDN